MDIMGFKEFDFQNNALNKLYDSYIAGDKNVILKAPTGSGKTAILIKLMDYIIENGADDIAFVWLTPGAGELEEQSWENTSQNARNVHAQFLMDALTSGFNPGTVTFLNWEMVNRKGNIALKDGETTNLMQAINHSKNHNIKFILVIDEEHRNQTKKSQMIVDMFDANIIYRSSATPIDDPNAKIVKISDSDVISEGLITREVVVNDQFKGGGNFNELQANDQDFLATAAIKRKEIKNAYLKKHKDINPLVIIQFPDEKKANDEVTTKVSMVIDYLINELGETKESIAIWLSDEHLNTNQVEKNNSNINYLLMKQAVATGWDAPRAKILVKLRLNTSRSFTIQTIGRIRRMPEQKHYGIALLDNSFVYSNDELYVNNIIQEGSGAGLTQMGLKEEVDPEIFGLLSLKRKEMVASDTLTVTNALHTEFKNEFNLTTDIRANQKKLEKYGWKFGAIIHSKVPTGVVSGLEDLATLDTIPVEIPITETRPWGYRYDAVMKLLQPFLHVGNDLKDIRTIFVDLFGIGETGSGLTPFLQLRPNERYGFIINNAILLRNVVKEMDSHNNFIHQQDLFKYDKIGKYKHVPFSLPKREGYLDNGSRQELLHKNVYSGYSRANWVKQSKPEKRLEEQLEKISNVKWVYRSKDHGSKYFSIPYNLNKKDFYPDYFVRTTDNRTFILETKGAEGQNIDDYAEAKFYALKAYISGNWSENVEFAFIRPSIKYNGLLLFNNTQWSEITDDSPYWKPLSDLF